MKIAIQPLIIFHLFLSSINANKDWSEDTNPNKWNNYASLKIQQILNQGINGNIAKNLIIFLGNIIYLFINFT